MKLLVRRIEHHVKAAALGLLVVTALGSARPAVAAPGEDSAQSGTAELANPFSDFVPFEDEYDVDEDERFMYFGRFFGVSLGTGFNTFTGNIGKLYNTALPIMDFRLIYFFDFRLAGSLGISSASHAFAATQTGSVSVNLMRINADLKYYFNTKNVGAAITSASPYLIGGVSQTFRAQTFNDLGQVQKDNALAVSAGGGVEFALKPRKTSLGFETRLHQIFFRDRYAETFADDGIPDTTGNMVSFTTNVTFYF